MYVDEESCEEAEAIAPPLNANVEMRASTEMRTVHVAVDMGIPLLEVSELRI
jgi:hypothetical protein